MERLRNHKDFVAVLRHRHRVSQRDIVVHYSCSRTLAATTQSAPRLGLIVSKSVGNAVTRNTVKRRFRQLARHYEVLLPHGCDVIIRAKHSASTVSYHRLSPQVERAFTVIHRVYQRYWHDSGAVTRPFAGESDSESTRVKMAAGQFSEQGRPRRGRPSCSALKGDR